MIGARASNNNNKFRIVFELTHTCQTHPITDPFVYEYTCLLSDYTKAKKLLTKQGESKNILRFGYEFRYSAGAEAGQEVDGSVVEF